MATTERVLDLLGLFQSRPVWTAPELAVRLGVTERTVRRDVDRLRELGYAIGADRGPAGGYRLRRGSVLPPLLLSDEEAVAVALCLRTAGLNGLVGQATTDPALRAATKLEGLLPSAARERVRSLAAAILPSPLEGAQTDTELLTRLADAVARRLQVRLGYADRTGVSSERRVEPHRLVAWQRRWYLSAHDLDRADWRTFRLDRIVEAHVTTFGFRPRADEPDVAARLRERDPASYRHQVILEVDASLQDLAGYAPYAELTAMDATRTRLVGGGDDPERAAQWLLRFEHPYRLVGDEEVRQALGRLRDRLDRALSG